MRGFIAAIAGLSVVACTGVPAAPGEAGAPGLPAVSDWQRDTFGVLSELPGKAYRGVPADGSSEQLADLQAWDWALGGAAIRCRHALEDGSYGGDTYIYENAETGALDYVYVTTAGFRTEGTIHLTDGDLWIAEEEVTGHERIRKVRSAGRITIDGELVTEGSYFDGEAWTPGPSFVYTEVPGGVAITLSPPGAG